MARSYKRTSRRSKRSKRSRKMRRSPMAYKSKKVKSVKCRMSRYKNSSICKKYKLRAKCRSSNSAECRKFKSRERKLRMQRRAKSRGGPGRGYRSKRSRN